MLTKKQSKPLSAGAQELIDRAFCGIDPKSLVDYHVHAIGNDKKKWNNFINPDLLSWRSPFFHVVATLFQKAFQVADLNQVEETAIQALLELVKPLGKHGLLAFDQIYNQDGMPNFKASQFHVSNDFVIACAAKYPEAFFPIPSIHPFRKDALQELECVKKQAAKVIKWLPNAMRFDPSDSKCFPFYKKIAELDMAILSHTGDEYAIKSTGFQTYGNPLLMRPALERGAKVIMAHSGGIGRSREGKNFDLFLQLMKESRYEGRLFGDISGLSIAFAGPQLKKLLDLKQLHHRLVNGSDYPIPAVGILYSTRFLQFLGLIAHHEVKQLNEIYDVNPLLFDFVLKRTLKHPKSKNQFPIAMFQQSTHLPV